MDSNQIKQFYKGQPLKATELQGIADAATRATPGRASSTTRGSFVVKKRRLWDVTSGGITAEGDAVLYKGLFLREYDVDGDIVAIGDETSPLATGHSLKPTWDWVRAH